MADELVTVPVLARFLGAVESRLTARIDAVGTRVDDLYGHVDGLYHRLDRLEAEYQMVVSGLRRLEERLIRLDARAEAVEHRLAGVDERLAINSTVAPAGVSRRLALTGPARRYRGPPRLPRPSSLRRARRPRPGAPCSGRRLP